MKNIEVYTRPGCSYCVSAKNLLTNRGLDFVEYDTSRDHKRFSEMLERSSQRTFPQIFIEGKEVGGFDALLTLDKNADLNTFTGS